MATCCQPGSSPVLLPAPPAPEATLPSTTCKSARKREPRCPAHLRQRARSKVDAGVAALACVPRQQRRYFAVVIPVDWRWGKQGAEGSARVGAGEGAHPCGRCSCMPIAAMPLSALAPPPCAPQPTHPSGLSWSGGRRRTYSRDRGLICRGGGAGRQCERQPAGAHAQRRTRCRQALAGAAPQDLTAPHGPPRLPPRPSQT